MNKLELFIKIIILPFSMFTLQRIIQIPFKHLRWRFLLKALTIFTKRFILDFDRVLNAVLPSVLLINPYRKNSKYPASRENFKTLTRARFFQATVFNKRTPSSHEGAYSKHLVLFESGGCLFESYLLLFTFFCYIVKNISTKVTCLLRKPTRKK